MPNEEGTEPTPEDEGEEEE